MIEYINLTLNIVFLTIIILTFRWYYRSQSVDPESEDITIVELVENLKVEINNSLVKSLEIAQDNITNTIFETAFSEESVKNIETIMTNSVTSALYNEENMENIKVILTNTVTELMQNASPMDFGSEPATEEELALAKQNAGSLMVSGMLDQVPFLDQIATNFIGEDWQQDAIANPKNFMLMFQQLQKTGVGNWLQSLGGGLHGASSVQQAQTQAQKYNEQSGF